MLACGAKTSEFRTSKQFDFLDFGPKSCVPTVPKLISVPCSIEKSGGKMPAFFGPGTGARGLLQALRFDFPSKMRDLDAYLSSYGHFRRFRVFGKLRTPF